jgi:hypothetical protein
VGGLELARECFVYLDHVGVVLLERVEALVWRHIWVQIEARALRK